MTRHRFDPPDHWTHPRPYTDASLRMLKHGRILPMEEARGPGLALRMIATSGLAALVAASLLLAWIPA